MTQTMRERLIALVGAKLAEWNDVVMPLGKAEDYREEAGVFVDAVLAELRTYVPPKDAVLLGFLQVGDEPEDNHYADETDGEVFTAIVDHIRSGK